MSNALPTLSFPPAWAHEDRGPEGTAVFWAMTSITIVVVGARFYSRSIRRSCGLDDWLMLVTVISFVAASSVVTVLSKLGGFRHLPFVPRENASQVALYNLSLQVCTVFAYGTGKFSIGYLILRLLPPTSFWRKWSVWIVISLSLINNWLQIILTWIQCIPAKALWDPTVSGVCWDIKSRLINIYVGGVFNVLVDVFLAVLPASFIWHLQMPLKQRVNLCVLLGLGLLAAMCGSIKLTYVHSLQEPDITWSTYDLDVWSGAELFVIIVCGSIPPLKILWDRYVRKIRSPTEDSSYYPKRTSGSNFTNLSKNGTLYSIQASHVEFVDQEAQKIPPGRIVATTMIDLHDIPASHLSM